MATPTPEKPITKVVRRQVFNFDTFSKQNLAKNYTLPTPVKSLAEALAESKNNEAELVSLINKGREASAGTIAYESDENWTIADKNNPTTTKFEGEIIPAAPVMALRRTLAMTVFGMTPEQTKEQKDAALAKAMAMIKASPEMMKGLKEQALALKAAGDAEETDTDQD